MQVRDGVQRCSPDDSIVHDYVDYIRQGVTGGTHAAGKPKARQIPGTSHIEFGELISRRWSWFCQTLFDLACKVFDAVVQFLFEDDTIVVHPLIQRPRS